MANTENLKGVRCPQCLETDGFVIQMTINVIMRDDGYDAMGGQFPNDHFPGRVIDDNDGLTDGDPIMCANRACEYRGVVSDFRESGGQH